MRTINVTDITLKKLSEDRAISLLFREKSAIANCADKLGVNAVELPAVKNIREDTIIYKTIAQNIQNAVLAIPTGLKSITFSLIFLTVSAEIMPSKVLSTILIAMDNFLIESSIITRGT